MTTPALPFTIAGRSPVDSVRLRWGGVGAVLVGILALFSGNAAGIVFGVLLAALGVASLVLSAFGSTFWYDIPTPQRYVVGTGAVVGFLALMVVLGIFILTAMFLQMIARNL